MITPRIEEFIQVLGRNQSCCLKCTAPDSYIGLRYDAEQSSVRIVVSAGTQRSADLSPESQQWLLTKVFAGNECPIISRSYSRKRAYLLDLPRTRRRDFSQCFECSIEALEFIKLPTIESDDAAVLGHEPIVDEERLECTQDTLSYAYRYPVRFSRGCSGRAFG